MAAPAPSVHPDLEWVQRLLWPASKGGGGARYAVISRGGRPVLLLPLGSRAAASSVLRRPTSDQNRRGQLLRAGLAGAARWGVLQPVLRDRVTSGTEASIERHLAAVLGEPVIHLGVTIGPPRPNRKPVLQVLTPRGDTIAYVKVGWNGLTRRLVDREASALQTFDRSSLVRVTLPEVIHVGEWSDVRILVLRSVQPGRSERIEARDPTLDEIEEVRSLRPGRPAGSDDPYWDELLERAVAVGGARGASVADAVATVRSVLAGDAVRLSAFHGDWTPWNMVATDRRLRVWDWERATGIKPFPLDVFHYHSMRAWFRFSEPLDRALDRGVAAGRASLSHAGHPPDTADPLAVLYLAELTLRFEENVLAGTDEALDHQRDEIAAALAGRVARLG